ncbi:MAG: hypothetical protein QUU85_17440, partial [Candidatus Eisenbacteria bacterium]|nr:hypothetical protein [Candidatus Eisenbacteria bacterium]
MSDSAPIDRLASMWGIHEDFYDIAGRHYVIPAETKVALLRAMGLPLDGGQDAGPLLDREVASAWSRILPPCLLYTSPS